MDNNSPNNNNCGTAGNTAAANPLSTACNPEGDAKPLQETPELIEHDTRDRGVWQFPVKPEETSHKVDSTVKAEPITESTPLAEADRGALAGPERIQAYAKLEFPFFNFYIQKLSVTIGRRPPPSTQPSERNEPVAAAPPEPEPEAGAHKPEDHSTTDAPSNVLHANFQQEYVKDEKDDMRPATSLNGRDSPNLESKDSEDTARPAAKPTPPNTPPVKQEPDVGVSAAIPSPSSLAQAETDRLETPHVTKTEESQTEEKSPGHWKARSFDAHSPPAIYPSRISGDSQAGKVSTEAREGAVRQAEPSDEPATHTLERFPGNKVHVDVDLGPIKAVSRDHARLFFNTDPDSRACNSWSVKVNGRNGLVLNGKWHAKDEVVRLRNGARIQIAERIFRFVLPSDVVYSSAEESPATEENYFDYGYADADALAHNEGADSPAGSHSENAAGELVYGSDSEDLRSDIEAPSHVASTDVQDSAAVDQDSAAPLDRGQKTTADQPRSFLKRVVGTTSASTTKKASSTKGPSKKQLADEKKLERLRAKEEKAAQRVREKALKDAEKERKKQERLAKEQEKQQKKQEAEERRQQAEREAQARVLQDRLDKERQERENREKHEQTRAQFAQIEEAARKQAASAAPQHNPPPVAVAPAVVASIPRKAMWTPTNPFQGKPDKPPYSFAALIAQAITDTPTRQATLQHIFSWLPERYPYFKQINQSQQLQAAIRRDLAVNRAFLNIPLPSGVALWAVEPEHAKFFDGNTFLNPPEPAAGPVVLAAPVTSPALPIPQDVIAATAAPAAAAAAAPPPQPTAVHAAPVNGSAKAGPSITVGRPSPLTYAKPATVNGTSADDAASMHDNEGYLPIIMHDNVLYLSPLVFATLTAQQLANLQTLDTKKALEILQAFVVNYFKQELKKRKKAEKLANGQRSATPISTPGVAGSAMKRPAPDDLNATPAKALKAA